MISYQWDSQSTMLQIRDKLRSAGFTVWIDVENMSGSTLESMAAAVENCSVFLMAISRKYLESPNLRSGKKVERPGQSIFGFPFKDGIRGLMLKVTPWSFQGPYLSSLSIKCREIRYDNADVIETLVITNFHLYLI